LGLLLFALLLDASAAEPFLRLRETTLAYPGPADDFTNLNELRIGWFGPTNLNDPLTGDLWWAANLAVQEANDRLGQKPEIRNQKSERSSKPEARSSTGVVRPGGQDPQATDQETGSVVRTSSFGIPSDLGPRTSDFGRLPCRLIPRWAVDPWGTGVSQLTRMVYDEQPLALIGSVDSASTHLAEQVVAKANLPLVSPITTDPSVTLAGVSWMFACAPSDAAIARVLVDDLLATQENASDHPTRSGRRQEALTASGGDGKESQGLLTSTVTGRGRGSKLALLTCTDHESRMLAREVLRECSRRGRMPDFRFDVAPGAAGFARQMEGLVEASPATVVIVAGAEDAARWVRAVREKAPAVQVFGCQAMGRARFRELAGPAAEGVRFPLLFLPDATDPKAAPFLERFAAERDRPPDYTAVLTYDATRLLLEAIRRAGPNRARIREALTQLSPWPGLAGPIRFDGTGQNLRTDVRMGTIRSGAVVSLGPRELPSETARFTPHL
jgi:branched-chain amino acid transport system substrate-binding protein